MTKIDDGGPAFPHVASDGHPDYRCGMSLRDWFAGQALAGFVQQADLVEEYRHKFIAKSCYRLADAMLAARKAGS